MIPMVHYEMVHSHNRKVGIACTQYVKTKPGPGLHLSSYIQPGLSHDLSRARVSRYARTTEKDKQETKHPSLPCSQNITQLGSNLQWHHMHKQVDAFAGVFHVKHMPDGQWGSPPACTPLLAPVGSTPLRAQLCCSLVLPAREPPWFLQLQCHSQP